MSQSTRSERARRREKKLRNQRIGLAIIGVLLFALIAFLVYRSVIQPSQNNKPAAQSETGLQMEEIKTGDGPAAKGGDIVVVHYVGRLTDGTKFDSSYDRNQPFTFTLGANQVIKGWDEGIVGMKVGGKRKLIIPPALAYGSQGAGSAIPPDSTLVFEVELQEIK
jgi:FKBP-type peptidyl-prolyl cis-trans isomerase